MGRIKLFGICRRRADMSAEDFHDYWRHPHGTWGRHMTTLRGYVQSHQIHNELLDAGQDRYDCVAEMWLDNERDLRGFREEPVLVKYLLNDEPNFIDMSTPILFATEEEVLSSGPSPGANLNPGDEMWSPDNRPFSVKLLHFVGHDARPARSAGEDEALGKDLHALRHVRCWPLLSYHRDGAPFRYAQELWWPTVRAFRFGAQSAPGKLAALIADSGRAITLLAQAERFI